MDEGTGVIVPVGINVGVSDAVAVIVAVELCDGVEVGLLGDVEVETPVGVGETSNVWLGVGV